MSKTPVDDEKRPHGTPPLTPKVSKRTDDVPVATLHGDVFTEPLDARELTWIAEAAFGDLGQDLQLIRIGKTFRLRRAPAKADDAEVVLRIHTRTPNRDQVRPVAVNVKLTEKSDPINLAGHSDAAFWTVSAVEKFLIPYYETHRMLTDEQMATLKSKIRKANVLFVDHVPPSHSEVLADATGIDYHTAFTIHTAADGSVADVKKESLLDFVNEKE